MPEEARLQSTLAPALPPRDWEEMHGRALLDRAGAQTATIFHRMTGRESTDLADAFGKVVNLLQTMLADASMPLLRALHQWDDPARPCCHMIRVSVLMMSLARQIGMPRSAWFDIGLAGLLHDAGKMQVPKVILYKPGPLDADEAAIIRHHPEDGAALLARSGGFSRQVLDVCRHHHERYDGSGYPDGLSGEQISRAARMAAICDVYDALISARAYKPAWAPSRALAEMHNWRHQFDGPLLDAFVLNLEASGILNSASVHAGAC